MEESEVCSLPVGLAGVRKQFETQETASSHSVTQFHFQHRTVQEASNSEVTVSSSGRQVIPGSQHLNFNQETMVSYSDSNVASSYENHQNETEEEFPRYTTKELRDHFERTIEEAAPHKPVKMGRDINRSKWSSNVTQNNTVTCDVYEASATEANEDTVAAVMDYEDFPPPPAEDSEYLPPPPPDLLEMPLDNQTTPADHYSPEPPEPANPKYLLNREAYFKQRSMYELKRLYKHIHPEVRRSIEKEYYSNSNENEDSQLESEEYVYEDDGCCPDEMNDEEFMEWEEILPGDVQAMRWRFENKPLDTIKDDTPDEDDNNKKITEQEIILGKDVRRTAWMFETKPIDELGTQNTNSTEYKNKFNKSDKGDVRAAAWLFETQTMDNLNKMHKEEDLTKEIVFTEEDGNATIYMIDNKYMESLGHTETIDESHLLSLRAVLEEINGDVKTVTSTFDTQFKCIIMGQSGQMLEIKSVRKIETELENSIASRWLFDTQPLDTANRDTTGLKLVCSLSMEDSTKGDWGRWLFEIKTLNSLNEWENSQMETKEIIGADVRKHCLVFETQPIDSLKDESNARPQCIEEIIGGNVRSARHFFESSPQATRKNLAEVGKLKKATVHDEMKGDVRHQKWRFESQPLEHIREEKKEVTRTVNIEEDLTQEDGTSCRADVRKNCWVFETQPMDTLKDDSNIRPLSKEEIIAGNVRSARNYFETIPTEELKELAEVGKLKKTVALHEEKGDVRHQKWRFESQPLEQIREEKKEVIRTIDMEEIDKVDVSNYKQIFECTDLSMKDESQKIVIEGVTSGSVKSNTNLFESTPLYAMQDSSGHFHEVQTVRREEIVKGDVTTWKWMFETRPIDQFDESMNKYQIIKGISKQEMESGDVKTAKWLFETQPLDSMKYFSNIEDEETVEKSTNHDIMKGDVKTCKWLFETKPMDILYERVELKGDSESEEIRRGDVKTCTWLFETQALDTIHDETETVLKTCTVNQEDIRGKDVRTACFLFETEKLENLTGEERGSYKRVTHIDIASGDVSRMKYVFENQTSDIMTSTSEEVMQNLKKVQTDDIQKGNVGTCKWLFENQSIDTIHDSQEESMCGRTVMDVQGGDVDKGRFIFETYSLDKIHDVSTETDSELMKIQKIVCDKGEMGDVKNYTMMFETQPLYAIQDKEGHYHEVTTVTSEEVTRGDVVGTRWLFETKPLDAIKDTDEVYIIKSVTQQDVQKGDVTSAKWKFETQPLDRISEETKALVKTVEDIQGGNVQMNKHRFESDASSLESIRTVNVSEIQKGDVRTAKWRFETESIDKIRSMSSENLIETVRKEDVVKGDVKHSVWLFEKNPLDHIKEADEDEETTISQEEIPKADVKTTTWLFETTPFDDFNETKMEKTEILGKSVKGTLEELYSQKMVKSKGILIESDEIGDVRMAKYQLMNKQAPEIQREEIIRGDLQSIMMNLLNRREKNEQQIVIDSAEKGNISSTVQQLFYQEKESSVEREEILRGDIREAINNLFNRDGSAKHGILIQEDEKGDVQMTIYSLLNKHENVNVEKEDIVRGDIKTALQKLSSLDKTDQAVRIKVDDTEKGNVNFYSTCIESGALDYLKQLHLEPDETLTDGAEKEKIVGGDIKGTKLSLCRNQMQIERTVEDVIPGDVHNTVKVFMTEPTVSKLHREEIVKGDLKAALNSLSESVNQTVVVEKEEVVKGNIPKALRCLEKAQKRHKEVEKPDIIPGNIKGALRSLEKPTTSKVKVDVEDLVAGDVKATLKSLELAKRAVKEVEKEEIVRGDIHMALQNLQDASSERRTCQQEIDVQGDVRGTIQLLMESPPSPRMQKSTSLEEDVRGDVKMSIRSLYETQEQTQLEREEVIKGDVKGAIKSLLETAQRETPKVRLGAYRRVRVKQSPPVKNLNADTQRNIQKIKTANLVETSTENQSFNETKAAEMKSCTMAQSSTTVVEHKTITQKHGIKTVKTEFRNLKSSPKGMKKLDKTKVKTDVYVLKPQATEPDLPLPPPPPPVTDADLLPPPPPTPPPPPSVDSDIDHLPPPPPPLASEQDSLPPPPSQQELESVPAQAIHPSPAKAKKMTVKKVKAPALHPVPKLEPKVDISKTHKVELTSEKVVKMSQNQSKTTTSHTSKTVSCEIPPPPESPRPIRKVCISPVKFTPPPSPPPFMRAKMSKFNTPLIKAEEKYRKLKEENTPPSTPSPTFIHDSVTAALEMLSTEQANNTNTSETKMRDAEITAIESSEGFSVQKTSSVSAIRQQMHTTMQKTVSSKQSGTSVITEKVHTINTGVAKGENTAADRKKDSKNQKIKGSNKAEDKQEGGLSIQVIKSEISVTTEKNVKSDDKKTTDEASKLSKSPQRENKKKNDHSPTKSQVSDKPVQMTAASSNGKTSKLNQKVKKSNKQEKQAETKVFSESEKHRLSQDIKVETTAVRVVSESEDVMTELKRGINNVTGSPAAASATEIPTESQLETTTPTKKKKKSKKSKGSSQPGQGKDISTESKIDATETTTVASETSYQTQNAIAVAQFHKSIKEEQIQVIKEVSATECKGYQNSQQQKAFQKHEMASEKKKGATVIQQREEEPPQESSAVPITAAGESEQNKLVKSATGRTKESQRREAQVLISHSAEMENESKSLKSLFGTAPNWLVSPERKCEPGGSEAESDALNNQGILSHVKKPAEVKLMRLNDNETLEKHECESVSEVISGGATARISKFSIGSAKTESQFNRITSQECRKEEVSQCKSVDLRAPSPILRMRSPSPTFITIESTRRTDSPQRVTPSPTLLHRPPTPPTPPPRRCDTPTSRITRITPSPTFDKAENLARLKDTTAKLSRGVTPPPILSPQQIPEKKSEIVESPASFHRQIKIESQVVETSVMSLATEKPKQSLSEEADQAHGGQQANILDGLSAIKIQNTSETVASLCQNVPDVIEDISDLSSASVKEKREFFEEAQKAEINKTYVRKEPIAIPERLGPDMEEENDKKETVEFPKADLFNLVNKFESPEENIYMRKEVIHQTEQLRGDTERTGCDKEARTDILEQRMPRFDIQALKNVFDLSEFVSSSLREEEKDQEEPESSLSENRVDTSKQERPHETKRGSQRSSPLSLLKNEVEAVPAEPSTLSEAKSITEHFSNVDEFGNKVTGTRTAVTEHSESVSAQRAPFSYADAVKRKAAAVRRTETYDEDATEKLLRNFHKTWTESETVFKSLGFTVSGETTSQVVSHQTRTDASDSSSEVRAVHSMSEEGVSNGCSDSGQKEIP